MSFCPTPRSTYARLAVGLLGAGLAVMASLVVARTGAGAADHPYAVITDLPVYAPPGGPCPGLRTSAQPGSIVPDLHQSDPDWPWHVPVRCPPHPGDRPYESPPDTGPILSIFSEIPLPPESLQARISLNDDGNVAEATSEAYECREVSEGSGGLRFDFEPTEDVPEAFAFIHTESWMPLNVANTRALAFDVRTPVDVTLFLESKAPSGQISRFEAPITRYAPADDRWHSIMIPVSGLTGLDLRRIIIPFGLAGVSETTKVYVDHIRFTDYQPNHPPVIIYDYDLHLGEDEREGSIHIHGFDADGDSLTYRVSVPPTNGLARVTAVADESAVVTYSRTGEGRTDIFEVEVEDGKGHFRGMPIRVFYPSGDLRPVELLAGAHEEVLRPLIEIWHDHGRGSLGPAEGTGIPQGVRVLSGSYTNGGPVLEARHDTSLDLSDHHTLTFALRWTAPGSPPPTLSVALESETRGAVDRIPVVTIHRHVFPVEAPEGAWTRISIDLTGPLDDGVDLAAIQRVRVEAEGAVQLQLYGMEVTP